MKKKYKVTSPVRFFVFILISVMLIAFTLTAMFGTTVSDATTEESYAPDYIEVKVYEDDTLWDIVKENCDPSVDPRIMIKEICDINHIQASDLMVGDVILVPAA